MSDDEIKIQGSVAGCLGYLLIFVILCPLVTSLFVHDTIVHFMAGLIVSWLCAAAVLLAAGRYRR